ncbi:hypothetical protein [Bordetella sp. LUAb4]|uniref:hypothetical protein n=1 Tax=Bordetella sp. LUAb4 TaxID=2843195 RepID=UPI001E43B164|nr:hypothetical protein [Bordetella sp. LUAb4]
MLNELIRMLPPPSRKPRNSDAWVRYEAESGQIFPSDFKAFISAYGSGVIDDFIYVLDPFSPNPNLNFEKAESFQSAYLVMKQLFPEDYPRPAYPETGSFLPWAVTDNGDSFIWLVDGDPAGWKVALHSKDQGDEEIYMLGCVDFLAGLLRGEVSSAILPSELLTHGKTAHEFLPLE